MPRTRVGWWSAGLLAGSAAFFALLNGLVAAGQSGPGLNPWLLLAVVPAGLSAVLAGVAAAFAIFRRRERALVVFLGLFVGLVIVWFMVGELAGQE